MKLAVEQQIGAIRDTTRARVAMVRPVLTATVRSLSKDRVERLGGIAKVTLADLAREYREGAGDSGICFEYAVHDAIARKDPKVHTIISEVLADFCNIDAEAQSILFGAEKSGKTALIATAEQALTDDARILAGRTGQPPKLKPLLPRLKKAFNSEDARGRLPASIRGVWRADLFLGNSDKERWVATTLKINAADLEADAGIRIGIYPERKAGERPARDDKKNLIRCPLPYEAGFMELFYAAFNIVKYFLSADARLPKPVELPYADDRHVAQELEQRRGFAVLDVIDALGPMAQPELLVEREVGEPSDGTVAVAPIAKQT